MSALVDLQSQYVTDAKTLTGTLDRLKALRAIATWFNAAKTLDEAVATDINSYSIGGRSVSRRGLDEYAGRVAELEAQVETLIYTRGGGLADLRGSTTNLYD
jgi:hypothetical protein